MNVAEVCSCGSNVFCPCGSGDHLGWSAQGIGCVQCRWSQPQTAANGVAVERHRWLTLHGERPRRAGETPTVRGRRRRSS